METPRTNSNLSTKTKLRLAELTLLALFAYGCSTSPQDIASGIVTDGDNRREAQSRGFEYKNLEQSTGNPVDIYELRRLQAETGKESDELTRSRDRGFRNLGRAERRDNRRDHRNSVSGNKDQADPLKGKDIEWDPTMGEVTDEALRNIYLNN